MNITELKEELSRYEADKEDKFLAAHFAYQATQYLTDDHNVRFLSKIQVSVEKQMVELIEVVKARYDNEKL